MIETVIRKTLEYMAVPSVVGYEKPFMAYLKQDFKKLGLSAFIHEGLLEVHGAEPGSNYVCAHIDRHGLISLGDDEYVYAAQYMKEIKYGENNPTSRKEIEGLAKRFEGEDIYAYHPDDGHVISRGKIEACYPNMLNEDALFYVEGFGLIDKNVPISYARAAKYENGLLRGQIDNVVCVAAIYALYEAGYQGSALFACEEEIGKSWSFIAQFLEAAHIETERLLVLDTSPFSDMSVIEAGDIVFRNRDKSAVFNAELIGELKARCTEKGLSYLVKDEVLVAQGKQIDELGSTERGRLVQGLDGRWNGATIQIPTMMYHTSYETTSRSALEHFMVFLGSILIDDVV